MTEQPVARATRLHTCLQDRTTRLLLHTAAAHCDCCLMPGPHCAIQAATGLDAHAALVNTRRPGNGSCARWPEVRAAIKLRPSNTAGACKVDAPPCTAGGEDAERGCARARRLRRGVAPRRHCRPCCAAGEAEGRCRSQAAPIALAITACRRAVWYSAVQGKAQKSGTSGRLFGCSRAVQPFRTVRSHSWRIDRALPKPPSGARSPRALERCLRRARRVRRGEAADLHSIRSAGAPLPCCRRPPAAATASEPHLLLVTRCRRWRPLPGMWTPRCARCWR